MKKKMRKFAEGGFETKMGRNEGASIDDDVRARAMKSVEGLDGIKGSDIADETGTVKGSIKRNEYGDLYDSEMKAPKVTTPVSKTPAKPTPKGESADEYKTRMEGLTKKQALERVEPENYIPGTGLLKNIVKRGLKTITRDALPAPSTVKQLENKATKMLPYDKAGVMAKKRGERATSRDVEMKRGNARNYGIDPDAPGSASALESLRKNIGSGEFAMKKGGSVKSSASRRADGCAIRGKTRA